MQSAPKKVPTPKSAGKSKPNDKTSGNDRRCNSCKQQNAIDVSRSKKPLFRKDVVNKRVVGFNEAVKRLPKEGQRNVRTLQKWAKSKGWVKEPYTGGPQVWGTYNDVKKFEWRLKIKPLGSMRPGLDKGSGGPRFDARLRPGEYINPFTGQIGGVSVGKHIPLVSK